MGEGGRGHQRSLEVTGGGTGLQGREDRLSGAGKQRMVGDTEGGCSVGSRFCVCGEAFRLML